MPRRSWPVPRSRGAAAGSRLPGGGVARPRRHGRRLQGLAPAPNRAVALKMLLAGPCARPEELERFLRESQAVAGLGHPNIVQVYDIGDVEGRPYFTMELVEGGNLADQIRGVPQPARQAAAPVATLAEAIHAAHQSGIVHRDLKPANILLTAGRHAQGDRLRPGPAAGRRRGTDAERRAGGDAELHGPRASAGRKAGDRASRRTCTPWGQSCTSCSRAGRRSAQRHDGNAPAGADRRSQCLRHG